MHTCGFKCLNLGTQVCHFQTVPVRVYFLGSQSFLYLITGFSTISKFPSPTLGHIHAGSSLAILLISCTSTLKIPLTLYAVNVISSVNTIRVVAPHKL